MLEHALLHVIPGQEATFEEAFGTARTLIGAMPGFGGLSLSRCAERPSTYLLLVRWDSLEAHTEGFRGSAQYFEWKALLHHFYDPFPVVEHFREVSWDEAVPTPVLPDARPGLQSPGSPRATWRGRRPPGSSRAWRAPPTRPRRACGSCRTLDERELLDGVGFDLVGLRAHRMGAQRLDLVDDHHQGERHDSQIPNVTRCEPTVSPPK
ncbi:antibiotic biosynthesis monooxygenase [Oerskovia sp. M15]